MRKSFFRRACVWNQQVESRIPSISETINHGRELHLTRQSDYGVRAVLHLSCLPYGQIAQTKDIAAQEDIPSKYLPSIIRTLARAGIIRTLRGNQGGVLLSRPPEEINLREVIEAIEGPIFLVQCMREPEHCVRKADCNFLPVCEDVQKMMVDQLESTTFADLATGTYVEAGKISRINSKRSKPTVSKQRKPIDTRAGSPD